VPHRAELAIGAIVIVTVALVDLRGAIGFSSFGVLIYYFTRNAAAWRQRPRAPLPRALQVLGLSGCAVLVVTLPAAAVVVAAWCLVGVAYGLVAVGIARSPA
jgi:APA family basic amino acid/polyamine antiporter